MIRIASRWIRMTGGAVALGAGAVALSGCATPNDAMTRELSSLRAELASLRVRTAQNIPAPQLAQAPSPYHAPGGAYGAPPVNPYGHAANPYGVNQGQTQQYDGYPRAASTVPPGPPGVPAGPDLNAPPPLPVLKLDPAKASPFAGGEPPIRIGTHGPAAPPVAAAPGRDTFAYGRLDGGGNLVDQHGAVVYRAGAESPMIDTYGEEVDDATLYEDPHESPAEKVKRGTGVPRVLRPGEKPDGPINKPRPGVMALDDGRMLEAPQPGVQSVSAARLKQFQIQDNGLPEDRDYSVRVDPFERPRADPPPVAEPAIDDPIYRTPAPQTAQAPPVAAPAPVYPLTKSSYTPPEHAPGSKRVQTQKRYKGKKERRVQKLYKEAMGQLNGGEQPKAVKSFNKLLTKYADHDLADNALYWLGETAYARGDWLQSLTWFQDVILRYPEGNKLPDAMLKSALCYARLGDTSYAVQMLSEVEALFASAPVAEVARKRRLALAEGGH